MTSTRSILVVAVLVAAVAGVAGTALAVGHDAGAPGNETVTVTGSGDVSVAPDAAVLRLSVSATGSTAANATETVAADAAELRETLAGLGIPDGNVQSAGYDVHTDRRHREADAGEQYVARQRFEVTLEDVDRAGTVIDAAVDGGADEVHGVRFTLSESTREAARDEALRNAVGNARDEATVLADATGLELGGATAVSTTGTAVRPYRLEAPALAADGGASTDIDSRDVTVSATVKVVYAAAA